MNTLGIAVYLLVVLLAILAAFAARMGPRPAGELLHWLGLGGFFVLLAAARFGDYEHAIRAALREYARTNDLYQVRTDYQFHLTAIVIGLAIVAIPIILRVWVRRKREPRQLAILASRIAVALYLPLFALRIISFHATDRILYSSPIHLNWLVDGALAFVAGISAAMYFAHQRNRHGESTTGQRDG